MIHFFLLLVCILSVEVFLRLNFLSYIESILNVTKRVIYIIRQNNISDHWKEKIVPAYALRIMKYSLQILLILLLVMSLFFVVSYFFNDFPKFIFSLVGIAESMIFVFAHIYLRKLFAK